MISSSTPIPDHWTADEVVAVYDFLRQVCDAVWDKYEVALVTYYRENTVSCFGDGDPHDEIPF